MPGLFEVAEGGTVFLDEVEALPLDLQGRLLAALVERSVRRLGAAETRPHDVRVIAATHADLGECVRRGTFRADLLDRFRLATLTLSPLRESRTREPERPSTRCSSASPPIALRCAWPWAMPSFVLATGGGPGAETVSHQSDDGLKRARFHGADVWGIGAAQPARATSLTRRGARAPA